LILHELTAFIPLILFFYLFQAVGLGVGLLSWIKGTAGVDTSSDNVSTDQGVINSTGAGRIAGGGVKADEVGGWKGVVKGWYAEGEKRVERVGKKYGILGYDKIDKSTSGDSGSTSMSSASSSSNGESTERQGKEVIKSVTGSKAAEAVANAISAYVVVKVSRAVGSEEVSGQKGGMSWAWGS
jgi:hypothetical protein